LIVTYRWQIGVGYELTYAYREEKVMSYARSTCTTSNIYLHYTRCRKVMVTKDLAGAFCKQKTAREKMGDLLSGEFEKRY